MFGGDQFLIEFGFLGMLKNEMTSLEVLFLTSHLFYFKLSSFIPVLHHVLKHIETRLLICTANQQSGFFVPEDMNQQSGFFVPEDMVQ